VIRSRHRGIALLARTTLAALTLQACQREPDPEAAARASFVAQQAFAADAGAAWRLTSNDESFFDEGWYPMEVTRKDGVRGEAWRWMPKSALLRLRAHSTPMKLKFTGRVPIPLLGSPPTLTLRWNGNRVDWFIAPWGDFSREVLITEAMQRGLVFGDFTIETSATGYEPGEPRELGVMISDLRWEAARE
jgi:hypothetical protein